MATDKGESLPAILPTSVWFPTTPLLSFSWKVCGFPVTGIACPQALTPDNHFSSKSCAYPSLFLFRNPGFKSICAACDFGEKQS